MPTFRDRPLTWLFVIATVCIDLAAWAAGQFETNGMRALVMGQIVVLGVWAALGETHRLARGGVFVAVVLALSLPDFWTSTFFPLVHSSVLTATAFSALSCAAASWFWKIILNPFSRRPRWFRVPWQFSIVELLGWMIVVAVIASVARFVDSGTLSVMSTAGVLVSSTIGALFLTLPLVMWRLQCFSPRTRALCSLVVVGGLDLFVGVTDLERLPMFVLLMGLFFGYLWAWHWVQHLDDAKHNRPPRLAN